MGTGTHGVKASPEELEREVEAIRSDMDPVIDEIDRRRHDLLDWRLQLRRHRGVVVGFLAIVTGGLVMAGRARAKRAASRRSRRVTRVLSSDPGR